MVYVIEKFWHDGDWKIEENLSLFFLSFCVIFYFNKKRNNFDAFTHHTKQLENSVEVVEGHLLSPLYNAIWFEL